MKCIFTHMKSPEEHFPPYLIPQLDFLSSVPYLILIIKCSEFQRTKPPPPHATRKTQVQPITLTLFCPSDTMSGPWDWSGKMQLGDRSFCRVSTTDWALSPLYKSRQVQKGWGLQMTTLMPLFTSVSGMWCHMPGATSVHLFRKQFHLVKPNQISCTTDTGIRGPNHVPVIVG